MTLRRICLAAQTSVMETAWASSSPHRLETIVAELRGTGNPPLTERRFPVIECFGPTVQGEGALAGAPTLFVRFGGCDYRCGWCDSMYAVDPAEVRENAEKLTVYEIGDRLISLTAHEWAGGLWVTLSGGNPALMQFDVEDNSPDSIVGYLHGLAYRVAVETQGSIWRDWLSRVDHLTISPKPPSSGMVSTIHDKQTDRFLDRAMNMVPYEKRSLKVVVFDDVDYEWARSLFELQEMHDRPFQKFLSVGTDQDYLQDEYRVHNGIAERYRWLCEKAAVDPVMRDVKVLPQLHVIAFGTGRGV